jgi:hypothetical protein
MGYLDPFLIAVELNIFLLLTTAGTKLPSKSAMYNEAFPSPIFLLHDQPTYTHFFSSSTQQY